MESNATQYLILYTQFTWCFGQVHIRIASPPIKYPCYMGINIPTRQELVANNIQQDKFAEYFGELIDKKKRGVG